VAASVGVRSLSLCSAVVVTYLGMSLQAILTMSIAVSVMGLLIQGMLAAYLVRSSPGKTQPQEKQWQEMFKFGMFAWLQTITWVVFSHADRLIIGSFLGTAALAVYSVCLQLAQPIHGVIAAGFSVLFPVVSRRMESPNVAGLARDLKDLMKLNVVCSLALTIPGFLLAGPLLVLWMGQDFMIQGTSVLQWLVVACLLQAIQVVPHFILMASGDMKFLSITSVVGLGTTLGVITLFLPVVGIMGVVLGRLAGGIVECLLFLRVAAILKCRISEPSMERSKETDIGKVQRDDTCSRPTIVQQPTRWGVSIVVCSHNGVGRLPDTLTYLARQHVPSGLPWEVILVDNASTDGTAAAARASWSAHAPERLCIVTEPRMGLTHARCRGFAEARYEIVSFVDDDNWVCPEWVTLIADIMASKPEIGACGGLVEAQCETHPPWWFEQYQECYAVGPQSPHPGDVTWSRGYLWGAGLTVRKSAWDELTASGFRFLLTDRSGGDLHSGGDAELCLALRLAGWILWYEPRLRLRHFIPSSRLRWEHVKQVNYGFGVASPAHKAYYAVLENKSRGWKLWLRGHWHCQIAACLYKVVLTAGQLLLSLPLRPGNGVVLEWQSLTGTLRELMRLRTIYDDNFRRVQTFFRTKAFGQQRIGHQAFFNQGDQRVLHPQSSFLSILQSDDRSRFDEHVSWPRISIVIPSYNQGRYLEQTILSVLNQHYPNLELIVMDGGSTDDSSNIIRKYAPYIARWQSQPD